MLPTTFCSSSPRSVVAKPRNDRPVSYPISLARCSRDGRSDKAEFPYFSRMVSPDDERGQVGALVATMRLFDWDRVTIINTDTVYAKDMAMAFRGLPAHVEIGRAS